MGLQQPAPRVAGLAAGHPLLEHGGDEHLEDDSDRRRAHAVAVAPPRLGDHRMQRGIEVGHVVVGPEDAR